MSKHTAPLLAQKGGLPPGDRPLARWTKDGVRLHPHQVAGARRVLANRGGLLAFDVGVGKTYTALNQVPWESLKAGDTVRIPPNVKHWHGASPGSAMSHLAITEQLEGKAVEWMEKVSDTDFNAPVLGQPAPATPAGPTRAQQLVGDIAPKLAELTDNVLFADVWARPQLARRDRSLVTVSALIAMNRPDQLRSHLALAKQNGVTEEELSEAITHLAFYAGWPSAMSAATTPTRVWWRRARFTAWSSRSWIMARLGSSVRVS